MIRYFLILFIQRKPNSTVGTTTLAVEKPSFATAEQARSSLPTFRRALTASTSSCSSISRLSQTKFDDDKELIISQVFLSLLCTLVPYIGSNKKPYTTPQHYKMTQNAPHNSDLAALRATLSRPETEALPTDQPYIPILLWWT